jgi:predicted transcriptional regulator
MAVKEPLEVKLNRTSFMILDKLQEGRNTAANLAEDLDRARNYINNQMGYLLDYGLVAKVGPLPNSGLYELTDKGRVALDHRELYHEDQAEFERIVESEAED